MTTLAPDPTLMICTFRYLAVGTGAVLEARAIRLGSATAKGCVESIGFFDSPTSFVKACREANVGGANLYVGMNPRPTSFLDLAPNELRPLAKTACADDIEALCALYIDIDPVRPRDSASTDDELAEAVSAGRAAADFLEGRGFARPAILMSGNGVQLWMAVSSIELTPGNRGTVRARAKRLETDVRGHLAGRHVKVDATQDLGRIGKVIGSVSWKGAATPKRPYRVSAALEGFTRRECPTLRAYLLTTDAAPAPARPTRRRLPVATGASARATPANATPASTTAAPFAMCSPVRRLWDAGIPDDRSVAIFDLIMYLAHRGLALPEITPLVIDWDVRHGGKLVGRADADEYVRRAYDKITTEAVAGDPVAPPCKSLQQRGYCPVDGRQVRCELSAPIVSVPHALARLPADLEGDDRRYRLMPVFDAIVLDAADARPALVADLRRRFPMDNDAIDRELAAALDRVAQRRRDRERGLSAPAQVAAEVTAGGAPVAPVPSPLEALAPAPRPRLDGEIQEVERNLVGLRNRHWVPISSFTATATRRVETEVGSVIVCDLHTDAGATIRDQYLPRAAFNSRRDLLHRLRSPDLQWTGTDNEVQGLLRRLAAQQVPVRRGTVVLGTHAHAGRRVFVFPGGLIDATGFVDRAPFEYVPTSNAIDGTVRFEATDGATFARVAELVLRNLPRVNEPGVMASVIGWMFAAPVKPFCMEALRAFPILSITGTAGSGKTTLAKDVVLPLLGVSVAEGYSAVKTAFTLIKALASTNSVPQFIDEYKPGEMDHRSLDTLHRLVKVAYTGGVEERGGADLSVTRYSLAAPIILAGETRPHDVALLERFITATPSKGSVAVEAHRAAYTALVDAPLHLLAPRYLQFCLGRDLRADLAHARTAVDALLGPHRLPPRVVKNLYVMALGHTLYLAFAASINVTGAVEPDLRAGIDAVVRDVTGGSSRPRSALDGLVEALPQLVAARKLTAGEHFKVKGGVLLLQLESALGAYREQLLRTGDRTRLVDLAPLRRMAQEEQDRGGFVVAVGTRDNREYLGPGVRRRVIAIDLARATDLISVEDFGPSLDESVPESAQLPPLPRAR